MKDAERRKKLLAEVKQQLKARQLLLTESQKAIVKLLEQSLADITKVLIAQPSDYQLWYLPQISSQVEAILQTFVDTAKVNTEAHLINANNLGTDAINLPLNAAGMQQVTQSLPLLIPEQLNAVQQLAANRIADVGREFGGFINGQIGLVMVGNQNQHQALQKIQAKVSLPRYRLQTILKTELSRVYATAQRKRMEQLQTLLPGMKKRWLKSGKHHARYSHAKAHRQVVDINKPFNIGGVKMMQPHDPKAPADEVINCGCTMVMFMESWEVIEP